MTEATMTKKASNKATHEAGYAVFATGGKQYRAAIGEEVKIEKLGGEHQVGDTVVFDEVLLTDDGNATKLGNPTIAGAKVEAVVVAVGRAPKINVIKYKAKVNYFKKRGHRQPFLKVKVTKF